MNPMVVDRRAAPADPLGILSGFNSRRLLVVGDLMLDRYTWGVAEQISPEAPVPALRAGRQLNRLGGAANVAQMAHNLGAQVTLLGVVGHDTEGEQLLGLLESAGIAVDDVQIDRSRCTTVKQRYMGCSPGGLAQTMLRVDHEQPRPVDGAIERSLIASCTRSAPEAEVILVCDYAKGVCSERLLAALQEWANQRRTPIVVDPGRGAPARCYEGTTAIVPNRREAESLAEMHIGTPCDALQAARRLCQRLGLEAAVVKLDSEGIALACADGGAKHFPAGCLGAQETTGAGDMVLATLGMCLAGGAGFEDAVALANVAAGLKVRRDADVPLTCDELQWELMSRPPGTAQPSWQRKLLSLEALLPRIAAHRRVGARIVFTNGCFDLFHVGHLSCLEEARSLGDCLVVAVNGDASVRRLKGAGRPVVSQEHRAAIVAGIEAVDYVVLFDADTPHELLRQIRPEVLVKGGTYSSAEVVGRELVERCGGRVCVTGRVQNVSTTELVQGLRRGA